MAKHFPIKTLIGLAQDDVDAAAQRLGRAQRERNDVQAQLDALVQYRDEYHARFTASAQQGTTAQTLRNFQAFVDTLDAAIGQQRGLLTAGEQRLEAAKPEWRMKKQKLGSYEVLAARGEAVLQKKAARVEQRDADEHAAKILRMRAEKA
jgi:flagellar FliJ protein